MHAVFNVSIVAIIVLSYLYWMVWWPMQLGQTPIPKRFWARVLSFRRGERDFSVVPVVPGGEISYACGHSGPTRFSWASPRLSLYPKAELAKAHPDKCPQCLFDAVFRRKNVRRRSIRCVLCGRRIRSGSRIVLYRGSGIGCVWGAIGCMRSGCYWPVIRMDDLNGRWTGAGFTGSVFSRGPNTGQIDERGRVTVTVHDRSYDPY